MRVMTSDFGHRQVLGAVLAHGPERDCLPVRTILSNVAVKQIIVPAAGACSASPNS